MSESYEQFEQQVVEWVAAWAKRQPIKLSPSTCINCGLGRGLGVDGEDASELLQFLPMKSGVRFFDFPFDSFFGPELSFGTFLIRPLEFFKGLRSQRLTIADIAKFMFERRPAEKHY